MLQEVFAKAGIAFFMVDIFNRAINNDLPIFEKRTIIISGALVATSIMLYPIAYKKYPIKEGKTSFKIVSSKQE